jgi:hypothetical protein
MLRKTVKAFFRNLRGVAFFGSFTINTIIWFIPILLLAVVKLVLPIPALRRGITRVLMAMGENWVSTNWFMMRYAGSVSLESSGLEGLRHEDGISSFPITKRGST